METGCAEKKEEWKAEKRQLGREVRQAKKSYTRKGIEDKHKCSKTLWQGVKDHLGWESTGAPTMLEVGEGSKKKVNPSPRRDRGRNKEGIRAQGENGEESHWTAKRKLLTSGTQPTYGKCGKIPHRTNNN